MSCHLFSMISQAASSLMRGAISQDEKEAASPTSVPSHLYRFRSAKNLLERHELKNQEIYLARPEELNDPMEGFRDICWKGDEIVWRNLLRHYILCLDWAFSILCIVGEGQPIEWSQIAVFIAGEANFTPDQKQMRDAIVHDFLSEAGIAQWLAQISNRNVPVRRSELILYLRGLHFFAISIIRRHYEARGLLPKQDLPAELEAKLRDAPNLAAKTAEAIQSHKETHRDKEHAFDEFFDAQQRLMSELDLIALYNNAATPQGANWRFVFMKFCDDYVRQLETLVYPEWFTACFMMECRNSAVWGTYGDNHSAVCLKFKVNNIGGRPIIQLNRMNGYGGAGPIYMDVQHEFLKVVYENRHLPVDFFKSLGRLPIPVLKKYWYSDGSGRESACADDIFKNEENWRTRYWETFQHAIVRKLDAWSYEKEYRVILASSIFDFSEKQQRKCEYKFADLDGVIFGIKTPVEQKLEIAKIIEEKCREHNRTDFNFYQAYYSRSKGTIEHAKMSLLRFANVHGPA